MSEARETVRLDVWLWRARFFKTRKLACEAVEKRGVRITRSEQTRRVSKPGTTVGTGDVLIFTRARRIQSVEILDIGTRRGPASEAQALYRAVGDEDA